MLRKGRGIIVVLMLLTAVYTPVQGQFRDSVSVAYHKGHKLIGGLSGRNSILSGENVRIYELFLGMNYSDVFRVYWGFSFMPEPISEVLVYNDFTSRADTVITNTNISYLSMAFEYSFYRKKDWKISIPVQAGFGVNRIRQYKPNGEPYIFTDKMILPLETGVSALYYFNRWLGARAGLGMRFVGGNKVLADLSGPYYNIGIAIFFDEIYKMAFKE